MMRRLAVLFVLGLLLLAWLGPSLRAAGESAKFLEMTNKARADAKRAPLKSSEVLAKVAQAHADALARDGKVTATPGGKGYETRAKDAGYDYRALGVCFAEGEASLLPEKVFELWMKSKYRDNLLHPQFAESGAAVARSPKGMLYYVQILGTRK